MDFQQRPLKPHRDQTDRSLSDERHATDGILDAKQTPAESRADHETRTSREHAAEDLLDVRASADQAQAVYRREAGTLDVTERLRAERARTDENLQRERERTNHILEAERTQANEVLEWERQETRRLRADLLESERSVTDADLGRERMQTDRIVEGSMAQLRELSEHLRAVQEAERSRIAQAVHDELGQDLTALKMELSWLKEQSPENERLKRMDGLIDELIGRVRSIASELRPRILDDFGLAAAIEWQARQFEARTGVWCDLELISSELPIDPKDSTALFRVFQEILTNVSRHAQATQVHVRLAYGPRGLHLEVRDDGQGMPSDQVSSYQSLGLRGMQERLLACGGELRLASAAGAGTTVEAWIPLAPASASGDGAGR